MLLARWLNRLKRHLSASRRARPRYSSPLSPYGLQDWLLEDRTLMSAPPYAMPGNNMATGVSSVLFTGGAWPANPSKNSPAPPAKLVTIQNNTQQIIYPVLRDANSNTVYDPADIADQEYRAYIGFQVGGTTYLGLPPGATITIQVPLAFWDSENTYFVTDGENLTVPATPAFPGAYAYYTDSVRYVADKTTGWVAGFSTPGGNPYSATGGAVMFYRGTESKTFTQSALAQLTEWTIRDPYLGQYFGVPGGNGNQPIFDYDVSYVNDALMPIAMEGLQSTVPVLPAPTLAYADYGYTGATVNFVSNPSDPLNDPSMQALMAAFVTNSNLPSGGLGSYFPGSQGWPAYYNPNFTYPPNANPPTEGFKIPSGANVFLDSPLSGKRSAYDQNQFSLTTSGIGPVQAPGATVAAGNSNPYALNFPDAATRDTFVTIVQGWITNKTPLTVTDNSTMQVVATGVTSVTASGATGATVILNTAPNTPGASWTFARTPSDYASQRIASIWYAWANYYLNTVLAGFNGAKYNGTFMPAPMAGQPALLVLDANQDTSNLKIGMLVGGTGVPAGTTIAYIDPNNSHNIYLSRLIPANVHQQYTFSKPTGLLPFTNDPLLTPITLSGFKDTSFANAFAAVVYETMVFEYQSTFATPQNAIQVVGKVIGADLNPANFKGPGGASDPYTVEHILRDRIKSILRGVPDFTLPKWSSESLWYPAPADTSAGGGQSYNAYNIDPFVWFVHDVLHFSGYGFSIDDDSGNVQAFTDQLFVTIGGPAGLPNVTQWSNQVQWGQQIAMAQILPPSQYVDPQYQKDNLLLIQDPISFNQIGFDNDLGPGAAVTGPGIPAGVRVIAVSTDSRTGKQVLVLNTSSAKLSSGYVRLIFTSKGSNASSVVDQNFAALNNQPNLGTDWTNVGSGGLKISNHQAVGISSGQFVTDEAAYTGPKSSLTDTAVAAVASISNSVTYSYAGVFARKDSKNDFYALLLVHDPNLNASSNFLELARFTPGLAGTVGGWTFLQVANLPNGYTNATSAELQLEVLGVGLHTSLQAYVKDPATNKTILALSWTEGNPIYQFSGPYAGGVRTNPINGPGTAGLLTFYAGGAFTNFTVFALNPSSPTLLGGSNDSNDAFVQSVYQSLLGRPADGAAESWVDQLENGVSPSAVVQAIEASTEYLNDQVNNLYEQYLGRAADPSGLATWVGILQGGGTFEQVISGLVSSTEYYNNPTPQGGGGTNSGFVASLYTNILGRTGSPTEIQGWVSAMANGTTAAQVANDFLSSQEYRTNLVESYYQNDLGRAPSTAGSTYWVNQLNQGVPDQVVQASIIGSPEGFADFSSQPTVPLDAADPNTAYVQFLYENLLGHSLDSGSDYWINLLDSGAAPSAVVQGIEASTEYLNDQVNNLYEQYLGRTADPGGLATWVGILQGGGTIEQVISGLVSSAEYYTDQGGTNSDYVASLYTNILGRTGSPSEIQGWVTAMANGTTAAQVANAFLSSQEYQTNLVEFDYQTYLSRPADAQSLAYWVNQLEQGLQDQALLAAILGSPEAVGIYS